MMVESSAGVALLCVVMLTLTWHVCCAVVVIGGAVVVDVVVGGVGVGFGFVVGGSFMQAYTHACRRTRPYLCLVVHLTLLSLQGLAHPERHTALI